jgi:hypothetical protein
VAGSSPSASAVWA